MSRILCFLESGNLLKKSTQHICPESDTWFVEENDHWNESMWIYVDLVSIVLFEKMTSL